MRYARTYILNNGFSIQSYLTLAADKTLSSVVCAKATFSLSLSARFMNVLFKSESFLKKPTITTSSLLVTLLKSSTEEMTFDPGPTWAFIYLTIPSEIRDTKLEVGQPEHFIPARDFLTGISGSCVFLDKFAVPEDFHGWVTGNTMIVTR